MSEYNPRYQQQQGESTDEPTDESQPAQTRTSARPKVQTQDDVVAQAKEDAYSPDQKHKNYLETLERLHAESVVGPDGKTPSTG